MRRKLLVVCLLFVVFLNALSTSTRKALSLEEDPLPPKVIDIFPPEGAELLPDDVLLLTFDQPMNQSSVEKAITFEPALRGQFTWEDSQTVSFKPQGGWLRGKSYTLNLTVNAAGANDLPIEAPYIAKLRTLSNLAVAQVSPGDNAESISLDAKIVVSFNRPVVALGAPDQPNLLIINPRVAGKGEWINTSIYAFTPEKPLNRNTKYTVRVGAGIKAVDGSILEKGYTWTFTTQPPQVELMTLHSKTADGRDDWIDSKSVLLDQPILIEFSQAMDENSTQAAFSLTEKETGQKIPVSFDWLGGEHGTHKRVVVTPKRLMKLDTDYIAILNDNARAVDGGKLGKSIQLEFHTQPLPAITFVSPKDGTKDFSSWMSVDYNVPMNFADMPKDYITLSPEPEKAIEINTNIGGGDHLTVFFRKGVLKPLTTYVVTLKAGLQDTYGNPITEAYTFSFTTSEHINEDIATRYDSSYSLLINGDIMITDATKANTSVQIQYHTKLEHSVKANLYHLPPNQLGDKPLSNHQLWGAGGYWGGGYSNYPNCGTPPAVKEDNLMRSWTITHKPNDPEKITVPLASDKGGKLPIGMYWITMGGLIDCVPNPYDQEPTHLTTPQSQFGLAVVTANLAIKRGTESVFVWVTTLKDTTPIANATVNIYSGEKLVGTSTTDKNGTAQLPARVLEYPMILITAETKDQFAVWYNYYGNVGRRFDGDGGTFDGYLDEYYYRSPEDTRGYIYTDRAIYRPGDTVYFRGVIRNKRDMDYPVPEKRTAHLKIGRGFLYGHYLVGDRGDDALWLVDTTVAVTDFGTFSGEYKLPEDAKPEDLFILVSLNEIQQSPDDYYLNTAGYAVIDFKVASYRAADFEVKVTPKQSTIIQGDPLEATIQGLYYSGGTVSNARVTWDTTAEQIRFRYKGTERYTFGSSYWTYGSDGEDEEDYYYYYYGLSDNTLDHGSRRTKTDSKGQFTFTSNDTEPFESDYEYKTPIKLTIEGTIEDETGQSVSGRASIIAYPTNLYIGVKTKSRIVRANEPVVIDLLTVNADSTARPNETIQITSETYYWTKDSTGKHNYGKGEITTDASGKAHYTFIPEKSGSYYLSFRGTDENGRANTTNLYLWVTDSKDSWVKEAMASSKVIAPLTDKRNYQTGENVEILVPVPFTEPALALITIERANVISYAMVPTDGPMLRYQMPVTDGFAPAAYVKVMFISKPDKNNPYPRYRISVPRRINVEPVKRRLTITVKPSTEIAKPGETVTFDLLVKDSEGKPARAEVGLALVDKAVLALVPPNSGTLEDTFYVFRSYSYWSFFDSGVYTDISLDGLLEQFDPDTTGPDGHGGGGPGTVPANLRQKFETTPLWSPHVVTDAEGKASISVKLPDNLTAWQLDVRALSGDMKVGQLTYDIVSTLPLIVRPVAPRFFVVGDKVQLATVINNNTNQEQKIKATLTAKGVRLDSASMQTGTIPANGRLRVAWWATVEDVAGVDLIFAAESELGLSDATKPSLTTGPDNTIPVYRYAVRDANLSTSGVLRQSGSRTEAVTLPPRFRTADGNLTVRVDPSLAAALTDSFTFLRQYPYYCIEQTVSRFLPNLLTYRALKSLNLSDPNLEANLKLQLDAAMTKLAKEQKPDGSWGWYPHMDTDPLTTAYAALSLIEARKAGFSVDQAMTDRAIRYVRTLGTQLPGGENWQLNRQAFYLYVLAQDNAGEQAQYQALFAQRTRLSIAGKAWLLMAYAARFSNDPAVEALTNDLISTATLASTGMYWTEQERDWWNWGTDTRTTALALNALIRVKPDSDLLPNVVRWLMAARQSDHWLTTQENVWSIVALTEWMLYTGELQGAYTYNVLFNRKSVADTTITPQTIRDSQTLSLAIKDLLAGNSNRLTVTRGDGTGALYYTAQFDLQVPAARAQAVSQGISVTRQYFKGDDRTTPITGANVGDVITVRLTITVPQHVQYFVLEDKFPAGTEGIDTSLMTTSVLAQGANFGKISPYDAYWYWGWSYFKETELRDSQINLYADNLPGGTYVYTYQLRASVPGIFQTIPTYAYTFYMPEIFGRSEGTLFTIQELEKSS